jgi:hypothetical protein
VAPTGFKLLIEEENRSTMTGVPDGLTTSRREGGVGYGGPLPG